MFNIPPLPILPLFNYYFSLLSVCYKDMGITFPCVTLPVQYFHVLLLSTDPWTELHMEKIRVYVHRRTKFI